MLYLCAKQHLLGKSLFVSNSNVVSKRDILYANISIIVTDLIITDFEGPDVLREIAQASWKLIREYLSQNDYRFLVIN